LKTLIRKDQSSKLRPLEEERTVLKSPQHPMKTPKEFFIKIHEVSGDNIRVEKLNSSSKQDTSRNVTKTLSAQRHSSSDLRQKSDRLSHLTGTPAKAGWRNSSPSFRDPANFLQRGQLFMQPRHKSQHVKVKKLAKMIKDTYDKDHSDESDFNSINSFDSSEISKTKSTKVQKIRISNLDLTQTALKEQVENALFEAAYTNDLALLKDQLQAFQT